jgi:creatinine amidohydrolase/Fe(II)-dependent formamide hydrolase-like protein
VGEALDAYVLPTVPFNTSEEHPSVRGTVSLAPATMILLLEDIVAGLRGQNFRKQVLTVGHGGVSRALALYLVLDAVREGAYGERVAERLRDDADYVGWERIVPAGS